MRVLLSSARRAAAALAVVVAAGACSVTGRSTTPDTVAADKTTSSMAAAATAPKLLSSNDASITARQVEADLCELAAQGFTSPVDRGDPPPAANAAVNAAWPTYMAEAITNARFYEGTWTRQGGPADHAVVVDHGPATGDAGRSAIILRRQGAEFAHVTQVYIDTITCPPP